MATPGGIKKMGMLLIKKSERPFTHLNFTHPNFKKSVSSNMPIMLDGKLIPMSLTIISPNAKQPKIITLCLIIGFFF